MKNRFIATLITFLGLLVGFGATAHADTCGAALTGRFTSFQAEKLCSVFGSAFVQSLIPAADATSDLGSSSKGWANLYVTTGVTSKTSNILKVRQDAQRLFTFDGSSDTALTLKFGDAGTTASQNLTISAATADGDDDATLVMAAGGSGADTQGGFINLSGNEVASVGGRVLIRAGNAATATLDLGIEDASSSVRIRDTTSGTLWTFANNGSLTSDATNGGGIVLAGTGDTIAIDSGTAASACKGTGTHNGTTAVTVSTTCAATGMHVSLTHTSDPTGSTAAYCWVTNIVNGTSFDVDCDQANDGTFAWVIIKEG